MVRVGEVIIEKCVLHLPSLNPMSRINNESNEGLRRVPVTLPFVSCLDREKYKPYTEESHPPLPRSVRQAAVLPRKPSTGLTIREKGSYEMFKAGMKVADIARHFHTSTNSIRSMIYKARLKLGERESVI